MSCKCQAESTPDEKELRVREVIDQYASTKGSLIAILQRVQELYNYIPADIITLISKELAITEAKIIGVVTFYTQFRTKPIGKHLIMLCKGTACHVNGASQIEEAITEALQISDGETTKDGRFTLMNVACLGCCSLSPVMMIGDQTYGKLTPQKTVQILQRYRQEEA